MKYDFSGYATKNNVKCADGRIIRKDAFKDCDGVVVPLVWQHLHDDPTNVLGHALLENRPDGVYAYGSFNESEWGNHAKTLVKHGDISSMSIFANRLVQDGPNVKHGVIREVSLVMAGANPEARIENLSISHSDGTVEEWDDEVQMYFNDPILRHADEGDENQNGSQKKEEGNVADTNDKTVQDVVDSMTDEQKNVMYFLIGEAVKDAEEEMDDEDIDEEGNEVKHNVFDNTYDNDENTLSHDDLTAIVEDAKHRPDGSLRQAFIAHGIESIDTLFPEAHTVTPTPEMIARPNTWVAKVWGATKKSPFARIKSIAANVTGDEARALGYVKGRKKKEEVVKVLKRITTPKTVYKLQKLDRDDIIDITDIDIVAWLKAEMRMMLEEELSRALMVGDGRSDESEDKISTENIRPIYGDSDVYTIYKDVTLTGDRNDDADALIDAALEARKDYMGSGNPTFYASTDIINRMLLAKDKIGRRLYSTLTELADVLRVSEIVEIPVMEGVERTAGEGVSAKTKQLQALIVNLTDYTIGADKGGEVSLFDDFDINYNKYEYLIETRVSGALTKPYSAIALESVKTTTSGGGDVQG